MRSTSTAPRSRAGTTSVWAWLRVLGGLGILGLLAWQVGAGPFLEGVRAIDGTALVAALAIGAVTTVCCAWRWTLIAGGLGIRLPLGAAVAAYYRSLLLNSVLPGGVLGDVHRALGHGMDIGNVGLGIRAVVLDRVSGQLVQVVVAGFVLFVLPSPVQSHMSVVSVGVVVAGASVVVAGRALARGGSPRLSAALTRMWSDIRDGLFAHRNWLGVVLASVLVVAGQTATFVLAARVTGVTAPLALVVALGVLAMVTMGLPLNVAGWGPREGVAAWAFAAAGLTATQGLATSVTYGVLALASTLPGVAVLLVRRLGRPSTKPSVSAVASTKLSVSASASVSLGASRVALSRGALPVVSPVASAVVSPVAELQQVGARG